MFSCWFRGFLPKFFYFFRNIFWSCFVFSLPIYLFKRIIEIKTEKDFVKQKIYKKQKTPCYEA